MEIKIRRLGKENVLEPKDNLSKEAIKNPLQQRKKVRENNHITE